MVTIDDVIESKKRLENLKQSTILRYSEDINFDNEADLYQSIIVHLVQGDFNDNFYSLHLENIEKEERERIMSLVNEYSFLCFHDGNHECWTDSVMSIPLLDYEYICTIILDNFNFLVELAKNGGKDTLDLLVKFSSNSDYNSSSVIDYLRNSFIDDNILENIIIDMSKKDSLYNIFSPNELSLLCTVPLGVLYFYDNDSIDFSSPILLAREIYRRETGEEENDFKEIIKYFINDEEFDNTIVEIQSDTLSDTNKYRSLFVEKYIKNKNKNIKMILNS